MNQMRERTLDQLFDGDDVRYRVPIYQRHYVWNETHWNHLWTDIEGKANLRLQKNQSTVPHFTGVIVTKENVANELEIVDGQQRLTTFQIIFCAIRDICKVKFPKTDPGEIQKSADALLKNPPNPTHDVYKDNEYKLLPTNGPDLGAFKRIIAALKRTIAENPTNGPDLGALRKIVAENPNDGGLLPKAYLHFNTKIEDYVADDYTKMVNLYHTLASSFKIVEISLERNDPASKIFESLNGRGLPLTQFDLLRNNVFLRSGNLRVSHYNAYWQHFNLESYWFSEKVVDDFLRNFLEAELNTHINSEVPLFDLYQRDYLDQLVKELKTKMDHEDDPKLVVNEFEQLGPLYNPKLVVNEFGQLGQYSKTYAEIATSNPESPIWFYQFIRGKKLQITSWHPLILLLKTKWTLPEESEKKILRILESYIVRYLLCYRETQAWDRQRHFGDLRKTLITEIRKVDDSSKIVDTILKVLKRDRNKWPNDVPQISEALRTAGNHWSKTLIQYILLKIECENTDPEFTNVQMRKLSEEPADRNLVLTLEHVMPKGWEKAENKKTNEVSWPIIAENGVIITESDPIYHKEARDRDHAVQSIGNLTILTRKDNRKSDDQPFDERKSIYKEYAECVRLSLANDIIYDEHNVEREKWDVKEIRIREKRLLERFCRIWPPADKF